MLHCYNNFSVVNGSIHEKTLAEEILSKLKKKILLIQKLHSDNLFFFSFRNRKQISMITVCEREILITWCKHDVSKKALNKKAKCLTSIPLIQNFYHFAKEIKIGPHILFIWRLEGTMLNSKAVFMMNIKAVVEKEHAE